MENTDQQTKDSRPLKLDNDNNKYGMCHWSDDFKTDAKGSNCPEFLFMRVFMKGLFK
jgi:hypothetical protein